jgi:aerobic-type carbon monoxide dehydrogenase small subunit (CoxS/CutS family)
MSDGFSRRRFLAGIPAGALGAAAASAARFADGQEKKPELETLGPAAAPLELTLNGAPKKVAVEPRTTLLDALRFQLGCTGPKEVCDRGACGACTVLLDGKPVVACLALAHDAAGKKVETVEGIGSPEAPHPLQRAFVECDALQCGFCTPGMVVALKALLDRDRDPSLDAIKDAVSGNVCRCGTYPRIFEAAQRAAKSLGAGGVK